MARMCVPLRVRLKRYSLSVIWRRLRLPFRRYLHRKRAVEFCKPYYCKDAIVQPAQKSILAIGNLSDTTGLSRAFQAEVHALRRQHEKQNFQAVCLSNIPQQLSAPDHLILLGQPDTYKKILSLFSPQALEHTYRTGFAVWEMQTFPEHWSTYLECVHEIFTPSTFSAKALSQQGRAHVSVVPHSLLPCEATRSSLSRATFDVKKEDFLGIAIMDLRTCPDRKNPHGAILAWQKAFGSAVDKVLLLKVRFSRRTQVIRQELQDLIGNYSNIRLIEDTLSNNDMRAFQSLADVYLSLHRAEGYGLNIAEMLALGKPSVVTDWSGNTDFTRNHPLVSSVPVSLIPYRDYLGTYCGRNLQWAEPDLTTAARFLRKLCRQQQPSDFVNQVFQMHR